MVIIIARHSDQCARLTEQNLRQQGAEVLFVPDSDLLGSVGLSWSLARPQADSFLTVDGAAPYPLRAISGVLARPQHPVSIDPQAVPQDERYIAFERHATVVALLYSLPCPVVNRPIAGMMQRRSALDGERPRLILQHGFRLPRTLSTSRAATATAFYDQECGQLARLSVPSGRGGWRLIQGQEGGSALRDLAAQHPVCLQQVPSGSWFQVFTVGDRAFATAVSMDGEAGEASELAPPLLEQCCRLAQACRLTFAQLQIVRAESGEQYCLEVSGYPDHSRCEEELRARITAALSRLLVGEARSAAWS